VCAWLGSSSLANIYFYDLFIVFFFPPPLGGCCVCACETESPFVLCTVCEVEQREEQRERDVFQ